jgi:hypothetical protein
VEWTPSRNRDERDLFARENMSDDGNALLASQSCFYCILGFSSRFNGARFNILSYLAVIAFQVRGDAPAHSV